MKKMDGITVTKQDTEIEPDMHGFIFETLNSFLSSEKAPEGCMGVSDLDGFLTGLVVSPTRIEPKEWLPLVWGEKRPKLSSREVRDCLEKVILHRYRLIEEGLKRDPADFEPYLWEDKAGVTDAGDWALGFVTAFELRMDEWLPLLQHKKAGALILPIFALCRTEDGARYLDKIGDSGVPSEDISDAELIELLPEAVVFTYDFWRMREAGYGVAPEKKAPKIGRNEPCPCGSGKKFKKCCG